MVVRLFLSLSALFLSLLCARYNQNKYFNPSDLINAECVLEGSASTYDYLGDRDYAVTGELCIPWFENYEHLKKFSKEDKFPVTDRMIHSKCRLIHLKNRKHPQLDLAIRKKNQEMLSILRGKKGPWCYVKVGVPKICFPFCKGPGIKELTTRKPLHELKLQYVNYNMKLIDNIKMFFKNYSWGDLGYYEWKPSDEAYSLEYYRIRDQIFYACVATVAVLVLWLLMCYFIKKKAAQSRRRREQAIKAIFPNRRIPISNFVRPHVS